jgi:hypothetical protein
MITEAKGHTMTEEQAQSVADALGGDTWQSGGDIWLIVKHRQDGRVVVISDEAVCEYASDGDFEKGQAASVIVLN